ncbi:hypothetical protein PR202_ga22304 [Eleusine coracana subsp. coracana]|uniref:Uncharacterized protein n=1 Tax=Eleusine coracana subsp. coracana TaxID=191504 RepID=A0AAV5D296_ELECO|nr:hypothetical protein PR202_ga22304 [Eleusine coracana subsp. coracana]
MMQELHRQWIHPHPHQILGRDVPKSSHAASRARFYREAGGGFECLNLGDNDNKDVRLEIVGDAAPLLHAQGGSAPTDPCTRKDDACLLDPWSPWHPCHRIRERRT